MPDSHRGSGNSLTDEPIVFDQALSEHGATAVMDEIEPVESIASQAPVATIRALHVINGEDYSGAERVQDLLALRLPEHGCDVAFACVKPDRFAAARKSQETPLFKAPMQSRLDLRPALKLARLIRQERYNLVHAHSPRAVLIGSLAAALARVPLVHHVHGQTAVDTAPRWRNRINAVAERWSLRRTSAIIACSATAERYMRSEGLPSRQLVMIPNGVPALGELPPRAVPRDPWVVGTVAMYRPRKGLEVLLDALGELIKKQQSVRLRIVGRFQTPQYEREIHARVAAAGLDPHIDWVGFTRDVGAELARMDLFVLPSILAEGMPMCVLEAMAAGVPVIGTRVEGVTDIIDDGRTGVLVAPGDSHDLATVVEKFIDGKLNWSAIRETAHRRQAETYSDEAMAAAVARLYRKVLGTARPANH